MGLFRRDRRQGAQAAFGWAQLAYHAEPDWHSSGSAIDRINQFPRIPVGILQGSVGWQKFNGVAYLDSGYNVPGPGDIPYWQLTRAVQNPQQWTKNGGPAENPMNGAVASRMAQRVLGVQPTGSIAGPGLVAPGVVIHGES